ncbi:hypothetical protein EZS27_013771 [termite gut metagenome]|uniref:Glycosyltransferase RgtA/B/C/D-like domain-containing protein n=1 Tax=termite gut metagenome TaxID=433724 RepID=A0A5J4RYA3_9ZZZZ
MKNIVGISVRKEKQNQISVNSNKKYFNTSFYIGFAAILLYYVPYLLYGENMYITIHDNLDATHAYLKVLKDSNTLFNANATFPSMDGLNSSSFSFQMPIQLIIVRYFSPFASYLINDVIGRIIAFIGMYLLLNQYVLRINEYKNPISILTSLCFSLMGYYSSFGLSVMGQPLLFYAFLNLLHKRYLMISYLLIIFIVLYSSLVYSGLFIGICLCLYYLYGIQKTRTLHKEYLYGLIMLVVLYILSNLPLFIDFCFTQTPSHRLEFQSWETYKSVIYDGIIQLLYRTQYHTGSLYVFPIVFITLIIGLKNKKLNKISCYVTGMIVAIILFYVFYHLLKLLFHIPLLNAFQMDRFYFLLPVLWMVLLAAGCAQMACFKKGVRIVYLFFALFLVSIFYLNPEYRFIARKVLSDLSIVPPPVQPTYKQFYDEPLFNKVAEKIGKNKLDYKVVCLGFFPSVAQYNGFYTLDGYYQTYPLEYKHKFRAVISQELAKSPELQRYYDSWGNRCYCFAAELEGNYLWGKKDDKKITNLAIDVSALKSLGCSYLLSAVEIQNYKELGLTLLESFTTLESYWNIKVYQL